MKVKRIAVWAYCGNNFGDDVFLRELVDRYPHAEFDIVTPSLDNVRCLADNRRVTAVSIPRVIARMGRYDAFVAIGGSLFQQASGWWQIWIRFALLVLAATVVHVPVAVVGLSFGPARTWRFRAAWRLLLRRAVLLTVRDADSLEELRLASAIRLPDLACASRWARPGPVELNRVGISVLGWGQKSEYASAYLALVRALLARGYTISLLACQDSGVGGDAACAARVRGSLTVQEQVAVRYVAYGGSPGDFASEIQRCEVIVGARFHVTLFGLMTGARVVALAYHEKIGRALTSMGAHVPLIPWNHFGAGLKQVIDAVDTASVTSSQLRDAWAAAAHEHFSRLDKVMDGERHD